jgi:hypothetical protein
MTSMNCNCLLSLMWADVYDDVLHVNLCERTHPLHTIRYAPLALRGISFICCCTQVEALSITNLIQPLNHCVLPSYLLFDPG